jgi:hypothetical protein
MVMGLCLLVYALAEHRLRLELVNRDETLPDQTGKPTQRITLRRVFQVFEGIDILRLTTTKVDTQPDGASPTYSGDAGAERPEVLSPTRVGKRAQGRANQEKMEKSSSLPSTRWQITLKCHSCCLLSVKKPSEQDEQLRCFLDVRY